MENEYLSIYGKEGTILIKTKSFYGLFDRECKEIFNFKTITCNGLSKINVRRILAYSIQRWKNIGRQINTIINNQKENINKLKKCSYNIDELYNRIGSCYIGNNEKLKANEMRSYQEKIEELCTKLQKICQDNIIGDINNIISILEKINEIDFSNIKEENIEFKIIDLPIIDDIHENYCKSF